MSRCIVVTGPPCAGKSSLARLLAARYAWPLLAKDDYKERVFRHLGGADRDWSRRVSLLAWELLLAEAARLAAAGVDCVLEGNVRAAQRMALDGLVPRPAFLEVRLAARPAVLEERYLARARDGSRHPGHVDLLALPGLALELAPPAVAPAPSLGACIECETSEGFDWAPLLAPLDAFAGAAP